MKKNIEIIELFSGIGGFTLGLQEAGFTIKKHYAGGQKSVGFFLKLAGNVLRPCEGRA